MQKTLLKVKVFPAILLGLMFLAVLPMQLKSRTVLPTPFRSASASSITISTPSTPTFQFGPTTGVDEAAKWTTDEAYSGSYSVLLASGTEAYSAGPPEEYSAGRVVIPVSKPLADITSISFYYMISEDAEATESEDFLTFAPNGETSGYLSPYVILHIKNDAEEHWVVSQTISVLEDDKGEWLQFDSTATDLLYYGTSGVMKWHDELWTDGDTVPDNSGWEELSFFQTTYDDWTAIEIKVAMGEWSTSELQTAYVDEVAVGAILIADPPYASVGDKVLVAGYGATPEETVEIYWDEVDDWDQEEHTGYLDDTTSDSEGDFKVEITVPEHRGDKVHKVIAYDTETEDTAEASFTIVPKIAVSPKTGAPGDTVEVEGTGFSKGSNVDVYFDEDDDWPEIDTDELVTTAETDKFGSFAPEAFDVPEVDDGDYNVWAIDKKGYSAKDVFTVTIKPVITLDPTKGRPGDEIDIEGKHFTEEEGIEVTVTFDEEVVGTYSTEEDGSFKGTFSVPEDAEEGSYIVTAEDERGLSAEADFEVLPPRVPLGVATVEIHPETLNLKSKGKWITVYIELPEGANVEDIDISTILLDDIPVETNPKYGFVKKPHVKDSDGNGAPELMVKFDRAAVIEYIRDELEITDGEVTLTITGEVNGETFEGSDTIRVISPGKGRGPKS